MEFRVLSADEIEVRFKTAIDGSGLFLLYKTARCDMAILDAVVGAENWQNKFYECNGDLFCSLGIKIEGEWVWKDDCGTEGSAGEGKSTASDARKRAGFAWGIGRELYTAPRIFIEGAVDRNGNLLKDYKFLTVTEVGYDENRRINRLEISNRYGVVFAYGAGKKPAAPKADSSAAPAKSKQAKTDSKADEKKNTGKQANKPTDDAVLCCEACGAEITPYITDNGKMVSVERLVAQSQSLYGKNLCVACAVAAKGKK